MVLNSWDTVRPDATQIFPQRVWHYNEPCADPSAIPIYYLAQLARRHVTVALNGDAGDENFAGYRRYITLVSAQRFDRLPSAVRRAGRSVARAVPAPRDSVIYRGRQWLRRLSETSAGRYSRRVMMFDREELWQGRAAWHEQFWGLLMLESWHRMFIDERPRAAPRESSAMAVESS